MGRVSRPWLAIAAVGASLVVIAAVAIRLQVAIPSDATSIPITRAILAGPVAADATEQPVPSDGSDPELEQEPPSPAGQACLSRMSRGSGWLDLCWEGYRYGGDADPTKDYYVLRVYGSHQGLRWISIRSQLIGTPGDNVYDVWPDGTYEGGCRQEPVSLLVPMSALAADDICGRTEAHLDFDHWSHDVVWTCEGCLIPDSDTRGVALYTVVGMPAGTVPSWDLFANGGS
jgi:hypothetical protein